MRKQENAYVDALTRAVGESSAKFSELEASFVKIRSAFEQMSASMTQVSVIIGDAFLPISAVLERDISQVRARSVRIDYAQPRAATQPPPQPPLDRRARRIMLLDD